MVGPLPVGAPAPWFSAPAIGGLNRFTFDTMAGRYILMLFYGQATRPQCQQALALVARNRDVFDDQDASFFGVTIDPSDARERRVGQTLPGIRHLMDADRSVSRAFSVMFPSPKGEVHRPMWMLFDTTLRLIESRPVDQGETILAKLKALLHHGRDRLNAPALIIPRVFEPELCRKLISIYEDGEKHDSGYMIESDGKTVGVINHSHKRRFDCTIEDMDLRQTLCTRIRTAIVPMVKRAYQFEISRIERWIIACYDAGVGGYFRPHRDNTTGGTAHRQFACSINLNAEEFEGGELRFPEFGSGTFRPPTGGAVIFSCSLLHEALPVTRGRRFAFLPFFYNEEASELRRANNALLGENVTPYTGEPPATNDLEANAPTA